MIKNYFKIAWRNIIRQKGYSGINITGLAIGIAACLLILQYVSFELSYETFMKIRIAFTVCNRIGLIMES